MNLTACPAWSERLRMLPETSDESFAALLVRACNHDETAAAELVRTYEPELRRFIRFRLTSPALRRLIDSLDICQSVLASFFVHLWAGDVRLTKPRQLMRMLTIMAQNKLFDKVRHYQADRRGGNLLPEANRAPAEDLPDPGGEPWEGAAGRELVRLVRDQLPEADRQLLDRWMTGHEWGAIAGEFGSTPEALRKRLSRAIDQAAQELGLIEETA